MPGIVTKVSGKFALSYSIASRGNVGGLPELYLNLFGALLKKLTYTEKISNPFGRN